MPFDDRQARLAIARRIGILPHKYDTCCSNVGQVANLQRVANPLGRFFCHRPARLAIARRIGILPHNHDTCCSSPVGQVATRFDGFSIIARRDWQSRAGLHPAPQL
ncbi:MAG: hypothetical protein JO307_33820 [Bryobacterales bacterium]|nr:hypothetical protein [Bryobacterales bacterium]